MTRRERALKRRSPAPGGREQLPACHGPQQTNEAPGSRVRQLDRQLDRAPVAVQDANVSYFFGQAEHRIVVSQDERGEYAVAFLARARRAPMRGECPLFCPASR